MTERYAQIKHYKTVYEKECMKEKTRWLIIADLDEFFYCHNSKLNVMLKNYEDVIVIYSNWRLFGSNGLVKHPADIRQAITHRDPHEYEKKYIFQTKQINSCDLSIHDIKWIDFLEGKNKVDKLTFVKNITLQIPKQNMIENDISNEYLYFSKFADNLLRNPDIHKMKTKHD